MENICSVRDHSNVDEVCEKSLECGHTCFKIHHHKDDCTCPMSACNNGVTYTEVTRDEIKMITEAMARTDSTAVSSKSHWYKCTNGHPFYVGGCGTPAEFATCYECKKNIGVSGGRLLGSKWEPRADI